MLGRALTSVFWGIMADRYGRKPVIIIGTIAVLVNALLQMSFNNFSAVIGMDIFRQIFDTFIFIVSGLFSTLSLDSV